MTIINFSVNQALEQKITSSIKEWGFNSRAEFFRFLAIDFVQRQQKRSIWANSETERLSDQLSNSVEKKLDLNNLNPIEDQLNDLLN